MKKRVTLAQIGKKVGVSPIAVSAALGLLGPESPVRVGAEKARRIREVAGEMGYQANLVARALRQRQTQTIGVLFRSVHAPSAMSLRIDMLNRALAARGYRAHLAVSAGNMEDLAKVVCDLVSWQVDGMIIHDLFDPANEPGWSEIEAVLKGRGMPVVMVDSTVPVTIGCASIMVDHVEGGRQAAGHVLGLGHRRVAFLGSPKGPPGMRLEGARLAAAGVAGACVEPYEYIWADWTEEPIAAIARAAERTAESYLNDRRGTTAVVCANDLIGAMVVAGCARRGLRVPEDLSVVGYDDAEYARVTVPGLTSVKVFSAETGRVSAELMLEQIARPGVEGRRVVVQTEVVVRGSTGPPHS